MVRIYENLTAKTFSAKNETVILKQIQRKVK